MTGNPSSLPELKLCTISVWNGSTDEVSKRSCRTRCRVMLITVRPLYMGGDIEVLGCYAPLFAPVWLHTRDGVIVTSLVPFLFETAQIGLQRYIWSYLKGNEPRSILNFWVACTLPPYTQRPTGVVLQRRNQRDYIPEMVSHHIIGDTSRFLE